MRYLEFQKALDPFTVFSITDIEKVFPGFDKRRLVEWQRKNYILKIRRGFYCFTDEERDQTFRFFAANRLYAPSYISLETAFSYYGIIPEGVFITTSVTSSNTAEFGTPLGHFEYRHMKNTFFFGYELKNMNGKTVKFAYVEKAILDFFYLNTINSMEEMDAIRFNPEIVIRSIDLDRLSEFQKIFCSPVLNKRISKFIKLIHA